LQEGTTYNAYVIRGADGKVALIDASHEKFREPWLEALRSVVDPADIDYIIISHTEPDHSGLIPDVIDLAPNATVVGSKVALSFLDNLAHRPFERMVVKNNEQIDLGDGHLLEFIMAPNLHWPDTAFTFDHATGTVFTCDAFGMHYCSEAPFDEELATLEPHYRFYYDCLMKPNAKSVVTALRKCKDLEFRTIAVGHGPLLRYNLDEMVGKYKSWSELAMEKALVNVCVAYTAEYGFCDRLSQSIARGLTKTDVSVEMLDLSSADTQELIEAVGRSGAIVLLAPPSASEAATKCGTLLSAVKSGPKGQKLMVAESYGGDDEPVDALVKAFVEIGVEPAMDPLRVKETPTESTYQLYEEAGTDLGQLLTQKEAIAKVKAAMNPDLSKALGRISGGLYVVTAQQGDARSAMIASWVSQASFEPLGLTVAVAKDRAIESLMQVGDRFVMNCLPEDGYQPLMKHFLKRFAPGADRFEGVAWQQSPGEYGPALEDAAAFMCCRVATRLEANDHWLIYAVVEDGQVLDSKSRTASHHRKVASYY